MKVKKRLNVSAEAYFSLLQHYLLKDLRKTVSKSIRRSDLKKGYRFDKVYHTETGEDFISHQEITAMEPGVMYQLRYSIPKGYQIITHRITAIDDYHIQVEYEEEIESTDLGIRFRKITQKRKSKKAMMEALKRLETEIITSKS